MSLVVWWLFEVWRYVCSTSGLFLDIRNWLQLLFDSRVEPSFTLTSSGITIRSRWESQFGDKADEKRPLTF